MKIDAQIKQELKRMYDQIRQRGGTVEIVSAYPLSEAEKASVAKMIPAVAEATVSYTVDPSIRAGLVVKHGTRMIDLSLRSELSNLQNLMYDSI
jgi:F-type H+-transporting ATPase subunit delta